MDLDYLLDGAKLASNLFLQFASNDILEHVLLMPRERGQACADF
jgi:hypothetical protein